MSHYIPCMIAAAQIYYGFNHCFFFQIQIPTVLNIYLCPLFSFFRISRFFNDVKICVTSYFMYGMSHEVKYCTFNTIIVRKAQISVASYFVY